MNISVLGQGKVGIVLATCLAAAGHRVTGVDVRGSVVDQINARTLASTEPGFNELFSGLAPDQFRATLDTQAAIMASDVTFIIVPTPSNSFGGFSLRYVLQACESIGEAIRAKDTLHTVAVVSTMLPGSSARVVIPALAAASGKQVGEGFDFCYCPAFIALGDIVRGFQKPDFLLIGAATERAGDTVLAALQPLVTNDAPVARMSPTEGEICKLASNTHETMRVSFANMLFAVCSEIPGADVDRITTALSHRMGRRFFKGAVPYGGPCWPRDNEALAVTMEALGVPARMPRSVDTFNAEHGRFIMRKVLELTPADAVVGVVGLAYKVGTEVVEHSFGVNLARCLADEGRKVIGWDPLACETARGVLCDSVQMAPSLNDCLRLSDAIVITNPLPEIGAIAPEALAGKHVVDCWRCLPSELASLAAVYSPLGIGKQSQDGTLIPGTLAARLPILAN